MPPTLAFSLVTYKTPGPASATPPGFFIPALASTVRCPFCSTLIRVPSWSVSNGSVCAVCSTISRPLLVEGDVGDEGEALCVDGRRLAGHHPPDPGLARVERGSGEPHGQAVVAQAQVVQADHDRRPALQTGRR